ncbi:SAVED domain-containing protein [Aeromonas media]|uniref:SAVED domain-containing protein n=1 Tax=Aeromonas media TaxID=651 RepID=UPI001923B7FB|nr:SAVED domain-containing protein [Aeromonas media]MBL0511960.1 SAVED domain-containing protein [Aeromonas media]
MSISSVVRTNISEPSGDFDDPALARWLDDCLAQNHRVSYIQAGYLFKVIDRDAPTFNLHSADPGVESKKSLKKLVMKKRLFSLAMSLDELTNAQAIDNNATFSLVQDRADIDCLISTRDGLLGRTNGRGPEISERTAQKVWADAGARCMFEGCGKNLSEISLWTKSARVGYLAHIVASDPEGPRGSQMDSHRLADNSDNIMLMCDEHHRLIDSFAPQYYTREILNVMRQTHRDIVLNYLNSLAFPRTRAVTLHANLANVPTYFHDSEFIEAIVATRRAMVGGVIQYLRRESQRDDRHLPEFWYQYLREHENQIRQLVAEFNSRNGLNSENLAIFPLHHIPTLVLAGRVMGEAQAIQVFQFDRERKSWAWDLRAKAHPQDTFNVENLPHDSAEEVLITLELTARIDEDALPTDLKAGLDSGHLPWIRVTTSKTGINCIGRSEDLEQFAQTARKAIVHAQDVMRVKKVRLIAVSPACTVFRFGQMLQAGNHPEYILYDRPGRNYQFGPAFSITGHYVTATNGQETFTIPLR